MRIDGIVFLNYIICIYVNIINYNVRKVSDAVRLQKRTIDCVYTQSIGRFSKRTNGHVKKLYEYIKETTNNNN